MKETTVLSPHASQTQTAHWFLVRQTNKQAAETMCVLVQGPVFTVGRASDADLTLPTRTVSSSHAELHVNDSGRVVLKDMSSTNGTYVNGVRVEDETALKAGDLIQFADVAMRLEHRGADQDHRTLAEDVYDQALALVQLDKLMTERAVAPEYQPIIDLRTRRTMGFEVLGRSRLMGLETPGAMFQAAAQMDMESQLSQLLRWEGVRQAEKFARVSRLFVNTHPAELADNGFVQSLTSLREAFADYPITLEIHEAAVTDLNAMKDLRKVLSDLDMELAYDDFGAGQARLVELVEAKPDYLKFDISLIRDIESASQAHQQLVTMLVQIALDLGVCPLAEGVEREQQSLVCEQMGFALGQGFYYGRPSRLDLDD